MVVSKLTWLVFQIGSNVIIRGILELAETYLNVFSCFNDFENFTYKVAHFFVGSYSTTTSFWQILWLIPVKKVMYLHSI